MNNPAIEKNNQKCNCIRRKSRLLDMSMLGFVKMKELKWYFAMT
jgi:hypothetical protein